MGESSVNRQLLFDFDDEYTEDDLNRDIKKTQVLPFTQIGTPSPYRAPAKSRVFATIKSSGPSDVSFSAKPVFQVKPMPFKSQSPAGLQNEAPSGLKTPSNMKNTWARPKPIGSLPVPQLTSSQPSTQIGLDFPESPAPSQVIPTPQEAKKLVSAQKASTKVVVPSRYLQQVAKIESNAKSAKKSAVTTTRNPLAAIDSNSTSAPDIRRATIAPSKKPAPKPSVAPGRTSVGHAMSQAAKHDRAASLSRISSFSTNDASLGQVTTQVTTQTTSHASVNAKTSNGPDGSSNTTATGTNSKIASQAPSVNPTAQADLRAALLQRREQKAAAKQVTSAKTRPSIGPSSSRPNLRASAATGVLPAQPSDVGQVGKTPGRGMLVRQQSANLELSGRKQALLGWDASAKVVPSRYANANPSTLSLDDTASNGTNDEISSSGSAAPTPTRTPRSLQRSLSTSSIKKSAATTAKKSAAGVAQSKNAQQIANMSARIAQTMSRDSASSQLHGPSASSSNATGAKGPTLASVQLEAQLLQSQLLQWHFINHRLDQARVSKRMTSAHMIASVLKKIEEMRNESDETERTLSARQAQVYGAELEQFKVVCAQPIAHELKRFLTQYEDTAMHLARDTHKMPTLGIASSTDLNALRYSMQEGQKIIDKLQREFKQEFAEWESAGQAIQSLTSAIKTETSEIKAYSEMLHAFSSLGNQQASLIIHKLHLQDATSSGIP